MKKTLNTSVIVSFYNKIDLLKIILTSLNNQYDGSFNVIIADDGSKKQVTDEIQSIKKQYNFELIHLWQEDSGFRKNRILNKAVKVANGYIIFIDGDCIPQKNFVHDHQLAAKEGFYLNGRRADLSKTVSKKINNYHPELFFSRHFAEIFLRYAFGQGKNIEKGLRVTNCYLSKFLNRKEKGIVGCNFSLFKHDLLSINGFDERYEAPGTGEDSDVEHRLKLAGFKVRNLFFKANQVHIYHKELPRSKVNDDLFYSVIKSGSYYTQYGIEKAKQ